MATISVSHDQGDDEASLWAAVEKLPTSDQLRISAMRFNGENGKQVDVTKLSVEDRQHVLERILRDTEEDNERFLRKLRERLDRVGIDLPKIEVRYHHLNVDAEAHPGSRATPSLPHFFLSILKWPWRFLGVDKKVKINILSDVSGISKPRRLTLLLGPPGSGRTSFLRALAGRLSTDLQAAPKPGTYLPFAGGTHTCPGNRLAMLNLFVFVHHLTTKFGWESIQTDMGTEFNPFPLPKGGFPIKVHRQLKA